MMKKTSLLIIILALFSLMIHLRPVTTYAIGLSGNGIRSDIPVESGNVLHSPLSPPVSMKHSGDDLHNPGPLGNRRSNYDGYSIYQAGIMGEKKVGAVLLNLDTFSAGIMILVGTALVSLAVIGKKKIQK